MKKKSEAVTKPIGLANAGGTTNPSQENTR
jgi:hypothetical protein